MNGDQYDVTIIKMISLFRTELRDAIDELNICRIGLNINIKYGTIIHSDIIEFCIQIVSNS